MKRLTHYLMKQSMIACALFVCTQQLHAQCPSGYSKFTLKWDNLDFFTYNANYTAATGYLPGLAAAQTQNFAFGSIGRVTINHNYGAFAVAGENTTHSGEAGSYGNSAGNAVTESDVQFIGDGRIILTFDTSVNNVQFSLFDVDQGAQANITAVGPSGNALPIDITLLAGSVLTLTNDNTTTPQVTSPSNTNLGTNKITAAFNVDIAGPVKQVTILMSNFNSASGAGDNGSFWLSDITACTPGSFPTDYYNVSKPYTGQPGYVLHSLDKTVYQLDPATGKIRALFTDPAVNTSINSMAYDPYNHILYYTSSGLVPSASAGADKTIKRYNFNTNAIDTIIPDITTLGIPVSNVVGVEAGGAAFYNGSLYLALQTTNSNSTSGRESIVWRIDVNGTAPYKVGQVYAAPTDDGTGLTNQWGDISIRDGELFVSNAALVSSLTHFNMYTGLGTVYNPGFDPGEMAVDWAGNLYQIHADTSASSYTLPYVALYTEDGNIGTQYNLVSNPAFSPAVPNLGDAAEAFRPKADFGDAPSSYDPAGSDPAMHEKDPNLRLGTNDAGQTWTKSGTTDPVNDDGIGAAPPLDYFGMATYSINVNVYNNTGAPATMVAWLDYNFNGVFEPGEGRIITTIPSSASTQLVPLNWPSFWVGFYPPATTTWLRIRLTSTANGMTTSNINGWAANGEVEDYPVILGTLLARNLVSFTANLNSKKAVDLNWTLNTTPNFVRTVIERSKNSTQWDSLSTVNAADGVVVSYSATDAAPYAGTSYYRLKLVFNNGTVEYSDVRSVTLGSSLINSLQIHLNPADQYTTLKITSSTATLTTIDLTDNTGRLLLRKQVSLTPGDNFVRVDDLGRFSAGLYYVAVKNTEFSAVEKLIIKRN